jgi:hypothetical protein
MTRTTERRTGYTVNGIRRWGKRCANCDMTWQSCSKRLWEDRKGPCCGACEEEETHDAPSLIEAVQLQEARDAEKANVLTPEQREDYMQIARREVALELKKMEDDFENLHQAMDFLVNSRVAAMTQGLAPKPIIFGKPIIRPAALFPRRMDPEGKRLRRDFTVRPTKHYIQTYYKIGG